MIRLAQAVEDLETALNHAKAGLGGDGSGRPDNVTLAEWRKLQAGYALFWTRKAGLALGGEKPPARRKVAPP